MNNASDLAAVELSRSDGKVRDAVAVEVRAHYGDGTQNVNRRRLLKRPVPLVEHDGDGVVGTACDGKIDPAIVVEIALCERGIQRADVRVGWRRNERNGVAAQHLPRFQRLDQVRPPRPVGVGVFIDAGEAQRARRRSCRPIDTTTPGSRAQAQPHKPPFSLACMASEAVHHRTATETSEPTVLKGAIAPASVSPCWGQ